MINGLGLVLAIAIFALDLVAGFDASVATLYVLVLLLAAVPQDRSTIYRWTGLCIALACAAFLIVHATDIDRESVLRLVSSLTAIVITGALLVSRHKVQAIRTALADSEAQLENFADSVPQILWRAQPDGRFDFLNHRFTDLTGRAVSDMLERQNWSDVIHPDDFEPFMSIVAKARAEADEVHRHFRMRLKDGSYRWMYLVGRGVRSPDTGEVIGWYGGTTDVHDQMVAQEEVRELARTLEQRVAERTAELVEAGKRFDVLWNETRLAFAEQDIGEAKAVLEQLRRQGVTDFPAHVAAHPDVLRACIDGVKVLAVNEALAKLLGYDDSADLMSDQARETAERSSDMLLGQLNAVFEGRDTYQGETVLVGKNGLRVPVAFHVSMASDTRAISSLLDISERERLQELRQAAQEELGRANRAATMGAFSASLAHELNQPIAAISMDAKTAQRWLKREPPDIDSALKTIARVSGNAERVAGIVAWSRRQLVKGGPSRVLLDVCTLARDTKSILEGELRTRRTMLFVACGADAPIVRADRVEIQQVLINLIVNAADAMQSVPEERRDVMLDVSADDDGMLLVSISDRGHGIAAADLDKLFDPFFTTRPGGMGMGLQICRSIVESAGGTIAAANRPEGGAVFTFTLPAAEEDDPTGADNTEHSPAQGRIGSLS